MATGFRILRAKQGPAVSYDLGRGQDALGTAGGTPALLLHGPQHFLGACFSMFVAFEDVTRTCSEDSPNPQLTAARFCRLPCWAEPLPLWRLFIPPGLPRAMYPQPPRMQTRRFHSLRTSSRSNWMRSRFR